MNPEQHDASDFSFPPWTLRDKLVAGFLVVMLATGGVWMTWIGWNAVLQEREREREEQRQEIREGGK